MSAPITVDAACYASYMVRIWQGSDQDSAAAPGWLADVEHIQSGDRQRFERPVDLWQFLRRRMFEGVESHDGMVDSGNQTGEGVEK